MGEKSLKDIYLALKAEQENVKNEKFLLQGKLDSLKAQILELEGKLKEYNLTFGESLDNALKDLEASIKNKIEEAYGLINSSK